ncbi:AAA family ATPase [Paenibacillus helianthi]|uniref:AAA family ATPase n=1 Tax=Paenibacillus helianthi TaxID=1349432 RepID=A0ABX3EJZ6_9BACL|nr:ATP-binding protein [Paenibacillus helianthi]OKP83284.1 AAA family ATPase [Paenibacillus helianthi]
MSLSREVRRLDNTWERGDYPKHLEWLEINNVRGWAGERVDFKFPIVAIVGENGSGKSTILQCAASLYRDSRRSKNAQLFPSLFFPDTAWEELTDIDIKASIREGTNSHVISVRKPTTRWRGIETRRERKVEFLDLRRIQPINARMGYSRLAKRSVKEASSQLFTDDQKNRFSSIIGKSYNSVKQSITDIDANRSVNVISLNGHSYSGFHQGAGEATIAGLLAQDIPQYSLVLIDEIETSLHPRAQRRLLRDLAVISREKKVQFIITTHSPYILDELPAIARVYVFNDNGIKNVVNGISSEFALTRMDEINYPELDIYVEDDVAKILIEEILAKNNLDHLSRCSIISYGSASVGKSLGMMESQGRFPRPSIIILDADQDSSPGCLLLPGDDAPERQIYDDLSISGWPDVAQNVNRSHSQLVNFTEQAATLPNHHDWIKHTADKLVVGGNELWRAMARSWVKNELRDEATQDLLNLIDAKLEGQS